MVLDAVGSKAHVLETPQMASDTPIRNGLVPGLAVCSALAELLWESGPVSWRLPPALDCAPYMQLLCRLGIQQSSVWCEISSKNWVAWFLPNPSCCSLWGGEALGPWG